MGHNPLGGVCGVVCPDSFCVHACSKRRFDRPVQIPLVQAAIVQRAKDLGVMPVFRKPVPNGRRVAILGAGPAGLGAASWLAQEGYRVELFDRDDQPGGMARLIPAHRMDPAVLRTDIEWLRGLGDIDLHLRSTIKSAEDLKDWGFDAVLVAAGLDRPVALGIPGEEWALGWDRFLKNASDLAGKRVLIVGGGAVAVDCASTAVMRGAASVELVYRRRQSDMPLTAYERGELLERGIDILPKTRVAELGHSTVKLRRQRPAPGKDWASRDLEDEPGSEWTAPCDLLVLALGAVSSLSRASREGIFYATDGRREAGTVVEAVASGKNAAEELDAWLSRRAAPLLPDRLKGRQLLRGRDLLPVPLECEFFGRKIRSPFLLSAAPHTDGYDQVAAAYRAGWSGAVMKTAFDGVPVHIPGGYMFALTDATYANCDNVSGHPLDRVCEELRRLVSEWPDRLTMASTGGPVTGRDAADRKVWQSNTRKLEAAGAMGIEYSLSCPQGGDGTKGDIVSQDARLSAKIVRWVLKAGDPNVPKLFKLTAAVTAIQPIVQAIRAVFEEFPEAKAGLTLANSFPSLVFRPGAKEAWEEGVMVGMHGEGVTAISNLTLAKVSDLGVTVSGNGGPMHYKAAADFLALGARTVQFCTLVMKHGLGIVDELHSGLSHLLKARGLDRVEALIGLALPNPLTAFGELSATKLLPGLEEGLCESCGNCTRCPYQAIDLDPRGLPRIDPAHCIGCSLCVQKCFAGALCMRPRTELELAAMLEG
jgi:NADPH-dependent glutamate synthase beta subunit-like oxidoreductase/dihydroorotate dehydrogenase/Pyruvate/2-oxoacid:ferredoxin oxidoreductase delta subunit